MDWWKLSEGDKECISVRRAAGRWVVGGRGLSWRGSFYRGEMRYFLAR